jgi:hypothetical protein
MGNKILGLGCALIMAGCASGPTEEASRESVSASGLPSWVMNPNIEDGFASTQCVPASGNMSIDRQLALANARTDLGQQLETKVAVIDKVFRERTDVSSGISTGSTFTSTAQQLSQQTLFGTRPEKVDYIDINGKKNLCVMVTMGREKTLALFDGLLDASNRNVQADVREVMLQQFKGAQAQAELSAEINK